MTLWPRSSIFQSHTSYSKAQLGQLKESTENMKLCTPSLRMNSPAIGFSPSQPTTSSLQSRATRQISLLLAGGWGVQGEEDVPDTEPVAVLP